MKQELNELLQNPAIWRADTLPAAPCRRLLSGFSELDALLGAGGWPVGAVIEVLTDRQGIGELTLLLSALREAERTLLWINPPYLPYAPGLRIAGVDAASC